MAIFREQPKGEPPKMGRAGLPKTGGKPKWHISRGGLRQNRGKMWAIGRKEKTRREVCVVHCPPTRNEGLSREMTKKPLNQPPNNDKEVPGEYDDRNHIFKARARQCPKDYKVKDEEHLLTPSALCIFPRHSLTMSSKFVLLT